MVENTYEAGRKNPLHFHARECLLLRPNINFAYYLALITGAHKVDTRVGVQMYRVRHLPGYLYSVGDLLRTQYLCF